MSDHVDKARAWDAITEKNRKITTLKARLERTEARVAELEGALTDPPCYDAGLLPEPNGASDDWWQDAMRGELMRAHEFYADYLASLANTTPAKPETHGDE